METIKISKNKKKKKLMSKILMRHRNWSNSNKTLNLELNLSLKMENMKLIKHKKSSRKKINFWNKSKLLKKYILYLSHGNLILFIWKNRMEALLLLIKNGFSFPKKNYFKVSKIILRKKLLLLLKITNQPMIKEIQDKLMALMQIIT